VIANFVAEYASGRTPIPCVRCNDTSPATFCTTRTRSSAPYVATGHYAIARDGALFRGRDPRKVQSYFPLGIDRTVGGADADAGRRDHQPETRAAARTLGS